jgi:hypothetical protein
LLASHPLDPLHLQCSCPPSRLRHNSSCYLVPHCRQLTLQAVLIAFREESSQYAGKTTHVASIHSPSSSSQPCMSTFAGKQLALSCNTTAPASYHSSPTHHVDAPGKTKIHSPRCSSSKYFPLGTGQTGAAIFSNPFFAKCACKAGKDQSPDRCRSVFGFQRTYRSTPSVPILANSDFDCLPDLI